LPKGKDRCRKKAQKAQEKLEDDLNFFADFALFRGKMSYFFWFRPRPACGACPG
jgi:hypothetical protein